MRSGWKKSNDSPVDYRFGRVPTGIILIAFGPSIKAGVVVEKRCIVDEPPTFAKVLGLDMGDIDGTAISEILKESI